MSHYFDNDPHLSNETHTLSFEMFHQMFTLHSAAGVFSKDRLDTGTRLLLETVLDLSSPQTSVLDLGCGIGTVGVVLSRFWPCQILGIDVNERAVSLANENYQAAGCKGEAIVHDGIPAGTGKFSCILLNPPIRAGKEVIYRLFDECREHLEEDGSLWLVMRKQHGAPSAIAWLKEHGMHVERRARDKGFWILQVTL